MECSIRTTEAAPNYGPCSGAASHSVSDKPEGSYEFKVRATDGAGNSRVETRRFSIDANLPAVTITAGLADGASTNDGTLSWTFTAEEGATFECRVYPSAESPPPFGPCSEAGKHRVSDLSPGSYTFQVRGFDELGDPFGGPVARRDFTVDVQAPRVVGFSPNNGASNVAPTANVTATFSEDMDAGTIKRANFKLTRAGKPVAGKVTYAPALDRATMNPAGPLKRGATYRATVTTGASDSAGNPLAAPKSWAFKVR